MVCRHPTCPRLFDLLSSLLLLLISITPSLHAAPVSLSRRHRVTTATKLWLAEQLVGLKDEDTHLRRDFSFAKGWDFAGSDVQLPPEFMRTRGANHKYTLDGAKTRCLENQGCAGFVFDEDMTWSPGGKMSLGAIQLPPCTEGPAVATDDLIFNNTQAKASGFYRGYLSKRLPSAGLYTFPWRHPRVGCGWDDADGVGRKARVMQLDRLFDMEAVSVVPEVRAVRRGDSWFMPAGEKQDQSISFGCTRKAATTRPRGADGRSEGGSSVYECFARSALRFVRSDVDREGYIGMSFRLPQTHTRAVFAGGGGRGGGGGGRVVAAAAALFVGLGHSNSIGPSAGRHLERTGTGENQLIKLMILRGKLYVRRRYDWFEEGKTKPVCSVTAGDRIVFAVQGREGGRVFLVAVNERRYVIRAAGFSRERRFRPLRSLGVSFAQPEVEALLSRPLRFYVHCTTAADDDTTSTLAQSDHVFHACLDDPMWWPAPPGNGVPPAPPPSVWSKPRNEGSGVSESSRVSPHKVVLVVRTYAGDDDVPNMWLLPTLDMFVDPAQYEVVFVLDDDSVQDHQWAQRLSRERPAIRVTFQKAEPFRTLYLSAKAREEEEERKKNKNKNAGQRGGLGVSSKYFTEGYDRQLWSTYHLDEYLSEKEGEVIGLVDSDAMFHSLLTKEVVFSDDGKLYVRCGEGKALSNTLNTLISKDGCVLEALKINVTAWSAAGKQLCHVMYGERMPQFVWRTTFANMRAHVAALWNMSFDEAWQRFHPPASGTSCNPIDLITAYGIEHEPHRYSVVRNMESTRPVPGGGVVSVALNRCLADEGKVAFGCCHVFGRGCDDFTGGEGGATSDDGGRGEKTGRKDGAERWVEYMEGLDYSDTDETNAVPALADRTTMERYLKGLLQDPVWTRDETVAAMAGACESYREGAWEPVADAWSTYRRGGRGGRQEACESVYGRGNKRCAGGGGGVGRVSSKSSSVSPYKTGERLLFLLLLLLLLLSFCAAPLPERTRVCAVRCGQLLLRCHHPPVRHVVARTAPTAAPITRPAQVCFRAAHKALMASRGHCAIPFVGLGPNAAPGHPERI